MSPSLRLAIKRRFLTLSFLAWLFNPAFSAGLDCHSLETAGEFSGMVGAGNISSNPENHYRLAVVAKPDTTPPFIYRQALKYVDEDRLPAAVAALQLWMQRAKHEEKILMYFDPRLDKLKKRECWRVIYKQLTGSYRHYEQARLAFLLDSLWAEGQKPRSLKYGIERLSGPLPGKNRAGDTIGEVVFPPVDSKGLAQLDVCHFRYLMTLTGGNYWPRSSEIGERPAEAFFFIVNHRLDTTVLAHFLPRLEQRCMEGEAKWAYYAILYDRLSLLQGRPQRYGTQYRRKSAAPGGFELFPLEDSCRVNLWRQELGLRKLEGTD